ncbi:MAG: hypothetical protein IKU08_10710 [Clostridia bacterium]|nr:hypothetical protein [Clostridia bacterium]
MPWIWLDDKLYPQIQRNRYNILYDCENKNTEEFRYAVADISKTFRFDRTVEKIKIRVSADNTYILRINGKFIGIGPASSGGDFLCTGKTPKHYADIYELDFEDVDVLDIGAKVSLQPEMLTNYSRGHGGFYLSGTVKFKDGTSEGIETDSTWCAVPDMAYNDFRNYNSENKIIQIADAFETEDIWGVEDAYIPSRSYSKIFGTEYSVGAGKTEAFDFEFDRIYGVHPVLSCDGRCGITLETYELKGQEKTVEKVVFDNRDEEYFSFRMHSAGEGKLIIENKDSYDITVKLSFIAPWYPVEAEGSFKTSSEELNKIYDVCKHTLKICRQSLHLDSTKHQELLACTGDYNIESLMTIFCYGDMRLAEFDLMRTADWLVANKGVMFHTTYSLIWVQMLHDVYVATGRKDLLLYCREALGTLLARFETYIGENSVIDNPPDFMFVDWTVIDGFSMHHPPKALGQTVLNCFYYNALIYAVKIYSYLDENAVADKLKNKASVFRKRFNEVFYDEERKLYFDGLGTPYGGEKHYHPANTDKKYFSKYPNILASLYGLADDELAADILERIIFDGSLQDIQPYFMHYMLCALRKHKLFDKYGMKILMRWADVVNECDKGLKEGWIAPEESYSFDHSHAWGGTPAYHMPSAITGMEILEPGMKTLKFSPALYGLDYAEINIPTQYGMINFSCEKGKPAVINAPECIKILMGDNYENS